MKLKKEPLWRRIVGGVLIVVGISGIILPILPGWLLIFIGLELIGLELVFFDRIKEYAKKKLGKKKKGEQK